MLIGSLLPILVGLPSGWFWSTFNRPLRVPLHCLIFGCMGGLHHVAGRAHFPSLYYLNIHKMLQRFVDCTFLNLVCVQKCYLSLSSPMHARPRHGPWKHLWMAKPCKGKTRVPNAIIGTNLLRETTPTENPRSSNVVGIEHKASNLILENLEC